MPFHIDAKQFSENKGKSESLEKYNNSIILKKYFLMAYFQYSWPYDRLIWQVWSYSLSLQNTIS